MTVIKSVDYQSNDLLPIAQALAERLGLSIDRNASSCLYVSEDRLNLKLPKFSLLSADFSYSTWERRKSEGKKQGLVRACKPGVGLKIIDATAGWGKDAAILASFGAEVLMVERNAIIATLLADALSRRSESDMAAMSLSLTVGDAFTYLSSLSHEEYPDIIYIDPMHPERSKSALVKKEMQALQSLIGPDMDVIELIEIARSRVKQRVVVKWPQKVGALLKPEASIIGKTVRFDIYFPRAKNGDGS
ncbi:class I SAM-dependent methyltransferase [Legionella waltersii]|uniref:Ribosomal RNA small subunit methyltransferase J n=1 Tax=Legionella waltersii TaxID=66969 RepID=A0A0W1A1N4_9GAMM|nr:class I SAM-dependent methyltransferase [Legionella waltersii]KTD75242.1 SAM-dependent methyltransferase [Legionella waltersii]SNV06670.1 N6-adenine-specific methylase [Legionella waltersii]